MEGRRIAGLLELSVCGFQLKILADGSQRNKPGLLLLKQGLH